jgi:hypothetical protein
VRKRARQNAHPVFLAAWNAAHSAAPDSVVITGLRELVDRHPDSARAAWQVSAELTRDLDQFEFDRMRRLLTAAINDGPVEPIPDSRRDLFAREEQLGHLSLRDAFSYLAELCPALQGLAECANVAAAAGTASDLRSASNRTGSTLALSDATDPLLASVLAQSIVVAYLRAVERADADVLRRSYFALPAKTLILSTTFGPVTSPD